MSSKEKIDNKRVYKCMIHLNNEGFFDDDGNWNCWICWINNPLNEPKGRIIEELQTDKFLLRIVDRNMYGLGIGIELYQLTNDIQCLFSSSYRDLSVALRKYKSLFKSIKRGRISKKEIGRGDPYSNSSVRIGD